MHDRFLRDMPQALSVLPALQFAFDIAPCPPGTHVDSTTGDRCLSCDLGTFNFDGSACLPCPVGAHEFDTSLATRHQEHPAKLAKETRVRNRSPALSFFSLFPQSCDQLDDYAILALPRFSLQCGLQLMPHQIQEPLPAG